MTFVAAVPLKIETKKAFVRQKTSFVLVADKVVWHLWATMHADRPNNPLHGITLEMMLNAVVHHYGWEELANQTGVRGFEVNPSVKSALKLLRTTPWARTKVEQIYLQLISGR